MSITTSFLNSNFLVSAIVLAHVPDVSLFNNFQISGGKSRELTGFELTVFDCEERNNSERLLDVKLNDWIVYKNAKKLIK